MVTTRKSFVAKVGSAFNILYEFSRMKDDTEALDVFYKLLPYKLDKLNAEERHAIVAVLISDCKFVNSTVFSDWCIKNEDSIISKHHVWLDSGNVLDYYKNKTEKYPHKENEFHRGNNG